MILSVLRSRDMTPFSIVQIQLLNETMRRRVNSRCKGLLEVGELRGSAWDELSGASEMYTVQYLHRTVKDYIESPDIQERFLSAMKSPYDAHLRHCIGILIVIKGCVGQSYSHYSIDSIDSHYLMLQSQISAFLHYAKGV